MSTVVFSDHFHSNSCISLCSCDNLISHNVYDQGLWRSRSRASDKVGIKHQNGENVISAMLTVSWLWVPDGLIWVFQKQTNKKNHKQENHPTRDSSAGGNALFLLFFKTNEKRSVGQVLADRQPLQAQINMSGASGYSPFRLSHVPNNNNNKKTQLDYTKSPKGEWVDESMCVWCHVMASSRFYFCSSVPAKGLGSTLSIKKCLLRMFLG